MTIIPKKTLINGFQMPVYGLGLWQMGGRFDKDTANDEVDINAIKESIKRGVLHIDTAESYGDGHAEELLKRAIIDIDRSKLFISTKVSGSNQGYDGTKNSLEKSLNRMGLEYVDLYILHRYPDQGLSIKETMRAMDELLESGKIRAIGVSNMTPRRFDEAQKYTQNKIVYNQLHYNVQYREVEKYGVLEHAIVNDYFLAAWRPLQKGLLENNEVLETVAKKYDKTQSQVAINWLISQKNVITLSKTSNIDHLEENLGALDWVMADEDIEYIREHYPNQINVSDAVPLNYETDLEAE